MTRLELAVEMIKQMRNKGFEIPECQAKPIMDNAVNNEYGFWVNMQYMTNRIKEAMEG